MTHLKKYVAFIFLLTLAFYGCKKEEIKFGNLDTPSMPQLEVNILGKDATHPNGDGSGNISIKITSEYAISYKVDFGDSKPAKISTSNVFNYAYSLPTGDNKLTLTVSALGKGGVMSTNSQEITIYRAFDPKPELVKMLTGTGTKKWRVNKDAPGNLGVGPAEAMTGEWWSAAPNEKAGLGIYDDIYTFTQATLTFTHTTNNDLFGKKEYLKDFDPTLTGDGDYTLTGPAAASYTEKFGYDGGAGGVEYLTFANKGHLGMYFGVHKYQIISRTDTEMYLKCLQDPGAWFVKIIAVQ